ncbi:MAG: phenylacetate--CoA ligase family protein [Christensenellales bacterium]|jgi:phenylacetate-CoA ligase
MMWNKSIEIMDRKSLEELQGERLARTVLRVYQNVEPYREAMDKAGVRPGDIRSVKDLKHLPFTEKSDLRDYYPNSLFAAPMSEIVRIHASSGTTGKPIVVGYTRSDLENWADLVARCFCCTGATKEDIIQVSYGYGLFTGGLGAHYGAERLGATVIPTSGGNTQRQILMMQDLRTTIIACTPSYALLIAESLSEAGIKKGDLSLKAGIFGAEPWTEEMRRQIEDMLGIDAYDIYGLSEVVGPGVAMECTEKKGMHIWEDHFIPEIINPETGEQLPIGEKGELVFTTITKEGIPMIRYRTHDLTSLIAEPCACGRTHLRMNKVLGRTDDMLIIRGVNIFPSQVEAALVGFEGVSPHYMLVVDRIGSMDVLEVQVEVSEEIFSDAVKDIEGMAKKLTNRLTQALGISLKVRLKEPKSIARSEGKAKRVIDNRKI